MSKKLAIIGTGMAVGSLLLITSVYAGIGDAPGYQAYKAAFKNTVAFHNVTHTVNASVVDNGATLLQVNSAMKADKTDGIGSGTVTLKGQSTDQTIQFYHQDGKQIVKTSDSDVYKVIETTGDLKNHKDFSQKSADPALTQEVENVIDALTGNLKNYVTMQEDNGSKDIHFALTGSQIPTVANTIGSLIIKHSGQQSDKMPQPSDTLGVNLSNLKDSLPKLAENIKVESVKLDAAVDANNHITNQSAEIEITGTDAQGAQHNVVVKLNMGLSNFDATTPDTIDLTGKQVENVKPFDTEGSKHWSRNKQQ